MREAKICSNILTKKYSCNTIYNQFACYNYNNRQSKSLHIDYLFWKKFLEMVLLLLLFGLKDMQNAGISLHLEVQLVQT